MLDNSIKFRKEIKVNFNTGCPWPYSFNGRGCIIYQSKKKV